MPGTLSDVFERVWRAVSDYTPSVARRVLVSLFAIGASLAFSIWYRDPLAAWFRDQAKLSQLAIGAAIGATIVLLLFLARRAITESRSEPPPRPDPIREDAPSEFECVGPSRSSTVAALAHATSEATRRALNFARSPEFKTDTTGDRTLLNLNLLLRPLLDDLVGYFTRYVTFAPTAACIKLLAQREMASRLGLESHIYLPPGASPLAPEAPLVFPLVRDTESSIVRKESIYYVEHCSAFEQLFRTHSYVFCPNGDLRELERRGEYRNPTPGWPDFYLSTLVLPIRRPPFAPETGEKADLTAFLCLDCIEPDRFRAPERRPHRFKDAPEDFNVAASVADALYWPIYLCLRRATEAEQKESFANLNPSLRGG